MTSAAAPADHDALRAKSEPFLFLSALYFIPSQPQSDW